MGNLLLAILSSMGVSVMLRLGEGRTGSRYGRFAVNYLAAAALAFLAMPEKAFPLNGSGAVAIGLGAFQGVLYLVTFIILQNSIGKNGVILSSTFARLGLVVPMVLAVFAFGELPSPLQFTGFLLAIAAIWIIRTAGGGGTAASKSGLLLLLVCSGISDSLSKVFERVGDRALDAHFLLITFLAAMVISLALMVRKGERLGWREVLWGCLVGVPNYGSVFFLLRALGELPAVLVYPTYSAGAILAISLVGVLAFRERPGRRQWCGLAVILLALVLLNL